MNPDRLIHDQKNFAELENEDVESFLRERKFNTEHIGIEFKSSFPLTKNNRFKYQDICKYVIAFLNSEGGLIIYGVDNSIHDTSLHFPDYICGLSALPSLEDLSEWSKNFIYPSTPSPPNRPFPDYQLSALWSVSTGITSCLNPKASRYPRVLSTYA